VSITKSEMPMLAFNFFIMIPSGYPASTQPCINVMGKFPWAGCSQNNGQSASGLQPWGSVIWGTPGPRPVAIIYNKRLKE